MGEGTNQAKQRQAIMSCSSPLRANILLLARLTSCVANKDIIGREHLQSNEGKAHIRLAPQVKVALLLFGALNLPFRGTRCKTCV